MTLHPDKSENDFELFPTPNSEKKATRTKQSKKNHVAKEKQLGKILIVEDESLIAENVKIALQDEGYEIVGISSSGEDAVKKFQQIAPDLVVMDIRLKGKLDGIQTAIIIQGIKPLPVIFLTAHPQNQVAHLTIIEPSRFMYITKPFSDDHLISCVRKMFASK